MKCPNCSGDMATVLVKGKSAHYWCEACGHRLNRLVVASDRRRDMRKGPDRWATPPPQRLPQPSVAQPEALRDPRSWVPVPGSEALAQQSESEATERAQRAVATGITGQVRAERSLEPWQPTVLEFRPRSTTLLSKLADAWEQFRIWLFGS